jgi:hypothetical protein
MVDSHFTQLVSQVSPDPYIIWHFMHCSQRASCLWHWLH